MNLIEYPDRDLLMLDLADVLASELADCLRRHETRRFPCRAARRRGRSSTC
jgi:6-phosphogluconolactonase